jgi:outer membrane lipoprotein SlyB
MKSIVLAVIAATCAAPVVTAYADDRPVGAVGGAVGGAAVGTVVGGPVGTVVGAGIGALVGSSLPSQPSQPSVVYQQPVVVGETLPETNTYYAVPQCADYQYIVLNNQRVIVDQHHRIVRVMP